jgi:hypothetical protein
MFNDTEEKSMVKKDKKVARIFFFILIVSSLFLSTKIAYAQSLRIIAPNGGQNWKINDKHYITWQSTDLSADVKVRLELFQGGRKIGIIASNLSINPTGIAGWKWEVGQYQGGMAQTGSDYKIRVVTMDSRYRDESEGFFQISRGIQSQGIASQELKTKPKPPFDQIQVAPFRIFSPKDGDKWQYGQFREIRWNPGGEKGSIGIELLRFGQKVQEITRGVNVAGGKYRWKVGEYVDPGFFGSGFTIEIYTLPPTRKFLGTTEGGFEIGLLSINSPLGGLFRLGNQMDVTWTSHGIVGSLRMILLWDRRPVARIVENIPVTSGRFNWTIGNVTEGAVTPRDGGGYQILIETQDNWFSAESNKFHILESQ